MAMGRRAVLVAVVALLAFPAHADIVGKATGAEGNVVDGAGPGFFWAVAADQVHGGRVATVKPGTRDRERRPFPMAQPQDIHVERHRGI